MRTACAQCVSTGQVLVGRRPCSPPLRLLSTTTAVNIGGCPLGASKPIQAQDALVEKPLWQSIQHHQHTAEPAIEFQPETPLAVDDCKRQG